MGARDVVAFVHPQPPEPAGKPLTLLTDQRLPAAEVPLVQGDRPSEPRLERRGGLEQILPVERVAHLQPEHVPRRQPAWHPVERRHRIHQLVPQVDRDVLVREQLEPDLPGVPRARHDHRPPAERRLRA